MKPLPILKDLSYPMLTVMALVLGLAPFSPEPHLTGKIRMLLEGELKRGIDIFDLFFHSFPILLLFLKFMTEKGSARH